MLNGQFIEMNIVFSQGPHIFPQSNCLKKGTSTESSHPEAKPQDSLSALPWDVTISIFKHCPQQPFNPEPSLFPTFSGSEQCSVVAAKPPKTSHRGASRRHPDCCHSGLRERSVSAQSHDILIQSLIDSSFGFSQSGKKPCQLSSALRGSLSKLAIPVAQLDNSELLWHPLPEPWNFNKVNTM